MNSHTVRILRYAYLLLEKHEQNKVSLKYLVDSLEGSYTALEEKLSQDLVDGWFDHWEPLKYILEMNIAFEKKY